MWQLARGYRFAGVACGIRPGAQRRDLALVVSNTPASAAGVFTRNRVCAAPVRVSRERLPCADARGVVICSGNANACTGQQGLADARRMTALAAQTAGFRPEQMLVCSTGVIGRALPMENIEMGIRRAGAALQDSTTAFEDVANSILTTDTRIKVATQARSIDGQEIRILGFAKGAAMIGPNMATMLAFVLTDAAVAPSDLQTIVARAALRSFNCVSVEGHTSTNDSLLLFANGSGARMRGEALEAYGQAVDSVCVDLARAIAADAEGATHLVTLEVEGLRDESEARRIAKAVADSALVKTAIYGADPNWGRIVSAAGYAGVEFDEENLSLWLGDMLLYAAGSPVSFDAAAASAYLKNNREVRIKLGFTLGQARSTFWTCDLTPEYVHLNADYTT
jgi:glutamate N-acetyltransferase/amino-acid N-acetyltransferase